MRRVFLKFLICSFILALIGMAYLYGRNGVLSNLSPETRFFGFHIVIIILAGFLVYLILHKMKAFYFLKALTTSFVLLMFSGFIVTLFIDWTPFVNQDNKIDFINPPIYVGITSLFVSGIAILLRVVFLQTNSND